MGHQSNGANAVQSWADLHMTGPFLAPTSAWSLLILLAMGGGRTYIRYPQVIHERFDDDITVLNLENGLYYALEGSATVLWSCLQIGATPHELTKTLVAYGVEFDAEIAVEEFLATLASAGLTTSKAPTLAPSPPEEFKPEGELAPPMIEEFGDMAELLLLDPVHEIDPVMGWPVVPSPDN